MSIYKDKTTKNWVVTLRYTDQHGITRRRAKRGFETKREASEWKNEFLANINKRQDETLDYTFQEFYEIYLNDISNLIQNSTMENKIGVFERYILPTFSEMKIDLIKSPDIIRWQNQILGLGLKATYCRSINNQLFALFNHAERFYNLDRNPIKKTYSMGDRDSNHIQFWTKDEFDRFISVIDDVSARIHFNVLFYTGIRVGELIAIRLKDINFDRGHLDINESAQYRNGEYIFSKPKTKKSERIVTMPAFLTEQIKDLVEKYYFVDMNEQVFMTNKVRLAKELTKYADIAKVKRIRIHDLRHSHASLLIEQGIQPNIVQERLGHERIETTLKTYSHLYPNKQYHLAEFLNQLATHEKTLSNKNNPLLIETIK